MNGVESAQDATDLTGPSLEQNKRLELVVKLLPSKVATVIQFPKQLSQHSLKWR